MKKLLFLILLITSNAFALNNGDNAPDINLKSFSGEDFSLNNYKDKIVVLEWTNPGCPFVKKHYEPGEMQALQNKYRKLGIVWVTINSTNKEHQDFLSTEAAKKISNNWKIDEKFMLDDHQGIIGKAYGAKSTPHMFIIDKGKIAYQGAIDSNPDVFDNSGPKQNYVADALDSLLKSEQIKTSSTQPYGCSVKYE